MATRQTSGLGDGWRRGGEVSVQAPGAGRAAFLTFCVFVALGSLALVLSIFEQGVFGEGNMGQYTPSTELWPSGFQAAATQIQAAGLQIGLHMISSGASIGHR